MMVRIVLAAACAVAPTLAAGAEEARQVTFTKDVLPIMQENCQNCHRPTGEHITGMIAPM